MKDGIKIGYGTDWAKERWTVDGTAGSHFHRLDGPALLWHNGKETWYVMGHICNSWEKFQTLANLSDDEMIIFRLKYEKPSLP